MPAHLLPLSPLVALVFTRLSSVAFHLFAVPFADEPSLPLIRQQAFIGEAASYFRKRMGTELSPEAVRNVC